MDKSSTSLGNVELADIKSLFPTWEKSKHILDDNHPIFHIHPVGDVYLELGADLDDKINVRVLVTLGEDEVRSFIISGTTLRKVDNEVRAHYPKSYVHYGPSPREYKFDNYYELDFDDGRWYTKPFK